MTEMQRQVQTLMRGFLVALSLAVVVGSGCRFLRQPYAYHGSIIETPVPAAPLNLTDQRGQAFQLTDVSGQVALIFFGYTHCPDICPTTLGQLRRVRAQLGRDAERTRMIFVTVDPERDNPSSLSAYLGGLDPAFIGLTGSPAEMASAWQSYGVLREKEDLPGASGNADNYAVTHSARLYLVDKQGRLRLTYTLDVETDALVADIQHVLQED